MGVPEELRRLWVKNYLGPFYKKPSREVKELVKDVDLPAFLSALKDTPIYGTFLDGKNMYEEPLTKNGIIIMGNEGNGISPDIETYVNRKLYIPNYPQERNSSESLNVAIATAIVCAEFRRLAQNG